MNRRSFMAAGVGTFLLSPRAGWQSLPLSEAKPGSKAIRALFPRLQSEVFLNAAGGTPLATFARQGMERYQDFWELGSADGRGDYPRQVRNQIQREFAGLIGAEASEIGLVHCTKEGEQIVLDSLPALRNGGNLVTNDLHFSGSLHNLVGLRRQGMDVRIVKNQGWQVSSDRMLQAMDDRTALVSITLLSNLNGHLEEVRKLADAVHARGGYLYADIIQAAGIYPLNMRRMGIDFAACSGYKWLFGPHGCGFVYVAAELQGKALPDHLFPGHVQPNYPPFVNSTDPNRSEYGYQPLEDARRYQPGHVSYLGYCALYEGLRFLAAVGIESALEHSLRLTRRLKEKLDPARFPCLSPHWERSPVITFGCDDPDRMIAKLAPAGVVISMASNRFRVSPAIYNNEEDIDRLADVLQSA